jgi:hypothetical protein
MENETSVQWKVITESGGHINWEDSARLQPLKTPETSKTKLYKTTFL